MTEKAIEIRLQNGLEARPVAVLVQVASKYDSAVYIRVEGKHLNAKSIMGMMSLGLINGDTIVVTADGSDETAAVEDLEKFLTGGKVELLEEVNEENKLEGIES